MRPVHILGLGLVIGMVALGAMVSVMSYRWQATTYVEPSQAPGAAQPGSKLGGPASADADAGKTVFQQRCSSCHTIGGGKLAGPDLRGITAQRPHDWLVQFITVPDKVVASGDPTATQLVQQYGGVTMPNVGVSNQQAEQILAYIDFQNSGASPPMPASKQAAGEPQGAAAGKTIFDQKCAGCHTIGGGKKVGPDLKGVSSQRPHDWLVNWIMGPDKMIAQNDPAATQLLKEYTTPMPNLGIAKDQAEQLLAYIDAQSR